MSKATATSELLGLVVITKLSENVPEQYGVIGYLSVSISRLVSTGYCLSMNCHSFRLTFRF